MTRIVHCKTWWDSCDWSYRAAESVQRELSCMAGFAQREPFRGGEIVHSTHRVWQDSPSGSYRAWQDSSVAHDLRGPCSEKGPSLARCSPGVFSNGALQGILNTWGANLAKTSSFWMHGGDILPRNGVFPVQGSLGNASGRYFARNVALRLIGVRFGGVSFKGCAFVCPK